MALPAGTLAKITCPPFMEKLCVVTGAATTHALVVVLKKQGDLFQHDEDAWPFWESLQMEHDHWQVGSQLEIQGSAAQHHHSKATRPLMMEVCETHVRLVMRP
eukprot:TRINITY_DN37439_c0_g1_i2.p1 TRINITY_DN37439_c0_g1~~TRINITY_DN37439_c0_g1_i2.p1  ORF type:complete len:103 (-),score=14.67 TRINITY_DN37439_c0_g1_i2:7-315(-)